MRREAGNTGMTGIWRRMGSTEMLEIRRRQNKVLRLNQEKEVPVWIRHNSLEISSK